MTKHAVPMFKRQFLYSATASFLGLIFFTGGMSKLYFDHRFPGVIGPVWLADRLQEYGLAFFAQFIAAAQITIGFMVLTPRYRTLGVVMLVPMIANILVVTISLQWRGTPFVLAFFLLLNMALLLHDAPRLLHLITGRPHSFPEAVPPRSWQGHLAWLSGLVLVFAGIGLSYYLLPLSYIVVVAGVVLAGLSRRLDNFGTK